MKHFAEPTSAEVSRLRAALSSLGSRIDAGDLSTLAIQVIPGALYCGFRPLRHHPEFGRKNKGRRLPATATHATKEWVSSLRKAGIPSIISLMHPNELKHYAALNLGADDLLDYYQQSGFKVISIPWDDPAHRPSLDKASYEDELQRVRQEALVAFDALPKPVLIHCSAGIDRSSPVAAFIAAARRDQPDA